MIFRQLFDQDTFTYTYLIASGIGREAIIIDPVDTQIAKYHKLLNELDIKLVAAIDTHVHADHITAIGQLRNDTDCNSVMGAHSKAECVSIKIKEDETIVLPGHDYNGFTSSTIGEEKRFNPRLQVKNAQEYAELMANLNLPNPKYMDVAVPANLKCGLVK